MLNPITIVKATWAVVAHYGTPKDKEILFKDYQGDERISSIVALYRELRIFGNFQLLWKMRSRPRGRDILWGRRFNDPTYINDKVIPALSNTEWLQSLPANTLGGHLGNLFKNVTLGELLNGQYKENEGVKKDDRLDIYGMTGNAVDDVRTNMNRYLYLLHDPYHVLFRYDTSTMGECAVQGVTYKQINFFPTRYCGLAMALRAAIATKSLAPFGVYFEAERLGKRAEAKGLWLTDIMELLHRDVQELREEFDIGIPVKYKKFCAKYPDYIKNDNIHPEYDDVEMTWTEATL
jgi:ubiquinone biosynthesis protein Coq4